MMTALSYISSVSSQIDVERTRRGARAIAMQLGFDQQETEAIVIATSELASNLARHATNGRIVVTAIYDSESPGIMVVSHDSGPGIADIALALQDGYSTRGSLGSGLPAVRRLMDELTIDSTPDGTSIEARKWMRRRRSPSL